MSIPTAQIFLYAGPGADPFFTSVMEEQLSELVDTKKYRIVQFKSFHDIQLGSSFLSKNCKGIVVGGGYASLMSQGCDQEFSEEQTERLAAHIGQVREVLKKYQIFYYGTCAGAILGSSGYYFPYSGTPNPHCCSTTLIGPMWKFYSGAVIAPLFESKRQTPMDDFQLVKVRVNNVSSPILTSCILGPAFYDAHKIDKTEIISRHEKFPEVYFHDHTVPKKTLVDPSSLSESIYCASDSPILLTGCHPELHSKAVRSSAFKTTFEATSDRQEEVAKEMEPYDAARKEQMKSHLQKLGLSCKDSDSQERGCIFRGCKFW